jgi:hypothetical protein
MTPAHGRGPSGQGPPQRLSGGSSHQFPSSADGTVAGKVVVGERQISDVVRDVADP